MFIEPGLQPIILLKGVGAGGLKTQSQNFSHRKIFQFGGVLNKLMQINRAMDRGLEKNPSAGEGAKPPGAGFVIQFFGQEITILYMKINNNRNRIKLR